MKKTRNYKEGYARESRGAREAREPGDEQRVCGKCKAEQGHLSPSQAAVRGQRMGDLVLVTSHMGPLST